MKKYFLRFVFGFFAIFALAACSPNINNGSGQDGKSSVPTYQGMTVSKNGAYSISKRNAPDDPGDPHDPNGPHNHPHDPHDQHDHNHEMDKDITDIVNIDVVTDDEVKYYVQPNETFIIQVHISNPKQFEIQSFTLNGKKYANYMFKDGSTMELLLLETTAPSTSGYIEYTIDAIKYIDGTEIKDVDMSSGNKTIKTGISYREGPTATVTSYEVNTTYINMNINVSDTNNLISNNDLSIYLSDGEKQIASEKLRIGDNSIRFDNLIMSTTYQYGVAATFDLVDGRDVHSEWLLTNTFTTIGAYRIINVVPSKTTISFEIERTGQVGTIDAISLYDTTTGEFVQEGDSTTRVFENLLSNHTYNLYVDFSYLQGEDTIKDWVGESDITTFAKIVPTLSFESSSSDKTSVTYNVSTEDTDGILNITKVELVKGDEVVKDNGKALSGSFTDLLSNNQYSVKVSYTYDLNDGQGIISSSITKDIKTEAKVAPKVAFESFSSDKTSLSYGISTEDTDEILNITKVELIKDGEAVKDNGTSLKGSFTDLLSNSQYSVKVSYTYDLNDGQGIISSSITKDIKTETKVVPQVSIADDNVTDTTISANLIFTDDDSVGFIDSVKIYKNEELVATNSSKIIDFADLDYYSDYTVLVSYSYDLNDGLGVKTETISKDYKTSPHLEFNSCRIINTSAVSEGDTIYMQATLNNPSNAIPVSAVVNGQTYNCSGSTSSTKVYLEIVNNGQFKGGQTELKIEKINMSLDGNIYSVLPNDNNSGTIFINGSLAFMSAYWVDENDKRKNFFFDDEQMYLLLTFENDTGYSIDKVYSYNNSALPQLEKIDDNHYRIAYQSEPDYLSIESIDYSNQYLNKTINTTYRVAPVLKYKQLNVVEVSNAAELLQLKKVVSYSSYGNENINNNVYIKLMDDIDLSSVEWSESLGNIKNSVFDGNGHKIKYMTNVSNYDTNPSLGLFHNITNCIFKDVAIEDITMFVTCTDISWGAFCQYADGLISFTNCSVNGDISFTCNSGNVGGFIGYLNNEGNRFVCDFDNCSSNMSISLKNESNSSAGSPSGYSRHNVGSLYGTMAIHGEMYLTITNCSFEGAYTCESATIINSETMVTNIVNKNQYSGYYIYTMLLVIKSNECRVTINGVLTTNIEDFEYEVFGQSTN